MSTFATPVSHYMTAPVLTIGHDERLSTAQKMLAAHRISSLAVVDADKRPVGVISRTDLIRIGTLQAGSRPDSVLMALPNQSVSDVMTSGMITVGPGDSIRSAAKKMVELHLHRVFVMEGDALLGVVSTKDVMAAIVAEKIRTPISEFMSAHLFTVRADEPVSLATERLERAHVSGVVVVDDGWPVGLFTQTESLLSSSWPRNTPVEDVMNHALACMNIDTPLFRAAAQAAATRTRRVIAVDHRHAKGVLSGLDFARAVSG